MHWVSGRATVPSTVRNRHPDLLPRRRNEIAAGLQQNSKQNSSHLQRWSSRLQGWSRKLQGCSRLPQPCGRQLKGWQASANLYCLSPKLTCLSHNQLLSELDLAKHRLNLLNPYRIAPAHVRLRALQFIQPKPPSANTPRNSWHSGARHYQRSWRQCLSSTRKLAKPLLITAED